MSETAIILHATTVALGPSGVLIRGAAGSGKSALALDLIAWGCALVADDRTQLTATPDGPVASCPPALLGLIEARGVGLLNAAPQPRAFVRLVVDLDQPEPERLPPHRTVALIGHDVALLHNPGTSHFAAAILQYLRAGRNA